MLQKKYALVERSYDKTKAVAFIDYVEGDDFSMDLQYLNLQRRTIHINIRHRMEWQSIILVRPLELQKKC